MVPGTQKVMNDCQLKKKRRQQGFLSERVKGVTSLSMKDVLVLLWEEHQPTGTENPHLDQNDPKVLAVNAQHDTGLPSIWPLPRKNPPV